MGQELHRLAHGVAGLQRAAGGQHHVPHPEEKFPAQAAAGMQPGEGLLAEALLLQERYCQRVA